MKTPRWLLLVARLWLRDLWTIVHRSTAGKPASSPRSSPSADRKSSRKPSPPPAARSPPRRRAIASPCSRRSLGCSSCSAQIIVNGSFESPVLSSTENYFGAFSFTGWSGASTGGTGNAGLVVGTDFGLSPHDGNQAFAFNGNNPAAGTYIEQTFNTITGQSYTVEFFVGRNGSAPSQALELQAQVFNASGSLLASTTATPPSTNNYTGYTFTFTADSSTSRLRLTDISGSNPQTDVFLDSVAVSAIPEPSTYALFTGLFAAIAGASRRRSKIRATRAFSL